MCDSVIDMLLNTKGRTKDGLNTPQYLAEMCIRDQLRPRSDGKKIY